MHQLREELRDDSKASAAQGKVIRALLHGDLSGLQESAFSEVKPGQILSSFNDQQTSV